LVHSGAPERGEIPLRQRRPRTAAMTEFDAALTTLGIKQRSAAQWFRTSERNIRRWKSGTRRTPPGVLVTVRLMMAGKIGPADVELAAASTPTRTNGRAKPEPPAPLVEPAPAPALADLDLTIGEKILALRSNGCRWPHGDPQCSDFRFCGRPAITQPYYEQHRALGYLPQQTRRKTPPPRFDVRYAIANLPHAALVGSVHEPA